MPAGLAGTAVGSAVPKLQTIFKTATTILKGLQVRKARALISVNSWHAKCLRKEFVAWRVFASTCFVMCVCHSKAVYGIRPLVLPF